MEMQVGVGTEKVADAAGLGTSGGGRTLRVSITLALLIGGYWLLAWHRSNLAYLDYVDGYYLYAAHRVAQGAILYRQVMGVQPPGIYLAGAALFRIHDSIDTARAYALLVHSATVLLVFLVARRALARNGLALLAATLYSLAPYSLVWSRTFDPNPLVGCLSLATVLALSGGTASGAAIAGCLGALALATKIWYLPAGAATILYMYTYRSRQARGLLIPYLGTLVLGLGVICAMGTAAAGVTFWRGLLAQDASGLSGSWLLDSLVDVALRDLPLVVLGLLGLPLLRRSGVGDLVCWYSIAACAVLLATVKAGTFAPVFQFAEPGLAIAAAAYLAAQLSPRTARHPARVARHRPPLLPGLLSLGFLATAYAAFAATPPPSDAPVRAIVRAIEAHSRPGATLLSPPYYLYLTGRRAFGEYADINLWDAADWAGNHAAHAWVLKAEDAVRRGAFPIIVQDMRVMRLGNGALYALLQRRYQRLTIDDPAPVDRRVVLWVPRGGLALSPYCAAPPRCRRSSAARRERAAAPPASRRGYAVAAAARFAGSSADRHRGCAWRSRRGAPACSPVARRSR